MENEKFQELVLEKFDLIDKRFEGIDKRFEGIDKRLSETECDIKLMLRMMEKFSNELETFGDRQERVEGIVLRIENDTHSKIRALFEKIDIQKDRFNVHEDRLKALEEKYMVK